jgi:hypothetical protein
MGINISVTGSVIPNSQCGSNGSSHISSPCILHWFGLIWLLVRLSPNQSPWLKRSITASPVSGLSHAVAADAMGMFVSVVYLSLKELTSQYSPVKLIAVKFKPKHVVLAWLSISDCAILFSVVLSWLICF